LNWVQIVPGAHSVLKQAVAWSSSFKEPGEMGRIIIPLLKQYRFKQFKQIKPWGGSGAIADFI
jgi:hypothetical protein